MALIGQRAIHAVDIGTQVHSFESGSMADADHRPGGFSGWPWILCNNRPDRFEITVTNFRRGVSARRADDPGSARIRPISGIHGGLMIRQAAATCATLG